MKCTCGQKELSWRAESLSCGDGFIHRADAPCYYVEKLKEPMNTETLRTDNHARCYQTAGMPAAYRVLLDLSRQLERELNEAKQINTAQGEHNIVAERDAWRMVAEDLVRFVSPLSCCCDFVYIHQGEADPHCNRCQALAAYEKLKGQ